MAKPKTNADGFKLVLEHTTKAEIARKIGQTRQAVSKWKVVPYEFVLPVEALSGVDRRLILPEMAAIFQPQKVQEKI